MSMESVILSNHLILCRPLLLLPSSFPASEFPVSRLFASGGQSIGASASASVLLMNIQGWFPIGLTGLISMQSKGLSRVFNTTVQNHQFFGAHPSLQSNFHICTWPLEKLALTIQTFFGKVMFLLFNMLSRFVIAFLPRSKCLLISWPQSLPAVILEPLKIKSVTLSTFPPSIHSLLPPSSRGSLVPLHFLPLEWYHLCIWGCWYFLQPAWLQLVLHPAQHSTWCMG